jgi:aldose 1-epimerase
MAMPLAPRLERRRYGALPDDRPVELFVLRAGRLELRAITYGAIITELRVPDRDGRLDDVVLGHDALDGYLHHSPYFGAVIGRCANRIARSRFTLDGATYQLDRNDGEHHLHGGHRGFDKVLWSAAGVERPDAVGVSFTYTSEDGEAGYPGILRARVDYLLTTRDELVVDYHATTDRATIVGLTQHSYFNLGGRSSRDILAHELTIHADRFTPVDASLIPTGALSAVADTPFDFRQPAAIGGRIDLPDAQLGHAGGYDHNFVLGSQAGDAGADGLRHAARVREPSSGRVMDLHTTEPGLQFYSGNFLDGTIRGKEGRTYAHRGGFCLEAQHFPDATNHPGFPSVVLRPAEAYRSRTVFSFSVDP